VWHDSDGMRGPRGPAGGPLVERQGDRLSLHELVRDFGRDILGENLQAIRDQVLEAALTYANRYAEAAPEHPDKLEAELDNLLTAEPGRERELKARE